MANPFDGWTDSAFSPLAAALTLPPDERGDFNSWLIETHGFGVTSLTRHGWTFKMFAAAWDQFESARKGR